MFFGIGILAAAMLAASPVAPVGGGNALTLPAQRHVLRIDPGDGGGAIWLLAVQQGSAGNGGLSFFRSDDEGGSWSHYADLQPDPSHRDRADLVQVGNDIFLVYSFEDPTLTGSSSHDVYFQRWRYQPSARGWAPDPAVRVFDSTSSSTAYSRALIARDSLGRIWVQAFRLESDGRSRAVIAVSTDGGASFAEQPSLDVQSSRGGGRLLATGGRLYFLYSGHSASDAAYLRWRADSAPVDEWEARSTAFTDGIYHGAALSTVTAPGGAFHVFYKDQGEQLFYRYFDGQTFRSRVLLEDTSDWSLQPAAVQSGDEVIVFYNSLEGTNLHDLVYRRLRNGSFSSPVVLDGSSSWKGYQATPEHLPAGVVVLGHYGSAATPNDSGWVMQVSVAGGTGSPPDAGTPLPDAGTPAPDAGTPTPDAGTPAPDAGTPPPSTEPVLLFSDDFERTAYTLGPDWDIPSGGWKTDGRAKSDRSSVENLGVARTAACGDCRVQASVISFGVSHAGLLLRVNGADRYELVITSASRLQIRRVVSGVRTVLADVPSGLPALNQWAQLTFESRGGALEGYVNGALRVVAQDSSPLPAGRAGMIASVAGVPFDLFRLWTVGAPPADGGTPLPDAGTPTPDAGTPTPDAGAPTPDAGTPTPDAGTPTPDAGTPTPDAGTPTPDAGTPAPDAGTPPPPPPSGILFSDSFSRADGALGSSWTVITGYVKVKTQRAVTDRSPSSASANAARSLQCKVSAKVLGFGVSSTSLFARAPSPTSQDRYELALRSTGALELRRIRSGVTTVLGSAPSGLSSLGSASTLSLEVSGTAPVLLRGLVNGALKVTAQDSGAGALVAEGYSGVASSNSGVWFDDFVLEGIGSAPPPPPADGGTPLPDAGTPAPDAGSPPPDAGTAVPDAGTPTPDAGTPPPADGGTPTQLSLTVALTNRSYDVQAVDPAGTVYATSLSDSTSRLYASTDHARSWSLRGSHPGGASFKVMTALGDGVLLANVQSGTHRIARSDDGGRTWSDVLNLGSYRALTPQSWTELDGEVFFAEYQSFTGDDATIRVWASTDRGRTWSVRSTHTGHRHAHGIVADPARRALWLMFGDTTRQSGTLRSTDAGRTWTMILPGQPGDNVDAVVLPNGDLLFGQDISYLPYRPAIARVTPSGQYTKLADLIGPSYSTHALRGGGFVVGSAREPGGDIYPSGETRAHLYGSANGSQWDRLLSYERLNSAENARIDVYWELASGELVLRLDNVVQGSSSGGRGYQLLRPTLR